MKRLGLQIHHQSSQISTPLTRTGCIFRNSNVALPLGKVIPLLSEILCYDTRDIQRILDELDSILDIPETQPSAEHPDYINLPLRMFLWTRKDDLIKYIPRSHCLLCPQHVSTVIPTQFTQTKSAQRNRDSG